MLSIAALAFYILCTHAATIHFRAEIAWDLKAPDGYPRPVITTNGQFPGPALIADQGDDVEFLVLNHLNESTSVHFHGIEQLNTPWSDGVAGLAQRPVPPGGEFLYKWTANDYGTYWYHGHYQSQIDDGLFGPIYIRPPSTQQKPFSKISSDPADQAAMIAAEKTPHLVMVDDWQHVTSQEFNEIANATNLELYCAQSVLINGKGRVNCLTAKQQSQALAPPFKQLYNGSLEPNGCIPFSPLTEGVNATLHLQNLPKDLILGCHATRSPEYVFIVDPDLKWASFNFINAGNVLNNVMSIDEHPMWIYAIDGRYIEPQLVEGLTNSNGGRYSVMVKLNKPKKTYTMRASNFGLNQLVSGFATIRYISGSSPHHSSISAKPSISFTSWTERIAKRAKRAKSQPYFTYGGFPVSPSVMQLNESTVVPFENAPPAKDADQTVLFYISRLNPPYLYTLKGGIPYSSEPVEYSEDFPLLYYPDSGGANNTGLVVKTRNNTWVDLVLITTDLGGPAHPMHKHSNKGFVVGQGTGEWRWRTVAEAAAAQPQSFNFDNPQYRDTFLTLASQGPPTWTVLRYHVINPGAFLFHCHIQVHLTGGMAVALLDGADVLPNLTIPSEYGPHGNGVNRSALQHWS